MSDDDVQNTVDAMRSHAAVPATPKADRENNRNLMKNSSSLDLAERRRNTPKKKLSTRIGRHRSITVNDAMHQLTSFMEKQLDDGVMEDYWKDESFFDCLYMKGNKKDHDKEELAIRRAVKEVHGDIRMVHTSEFYADCTAVLYDGIEAEDINQGELGDCYFLAALSAIAEDPSRITGLLIATEESFAHGVTCARVCMNGIWQVVMLDFYFPCHGHSPRPVYSSNRGSTGETKELWVMLLEKAWAKLFGSYEVISSGTTASVLRDLTGAPTYTLFITKAESGHLPKEFDENWEIMWQAKQDGFIMCAGSKLAPPGSEGKDDEHTIHGIVCGHAYSLLDLVTPEHAQEPGERIVKLRNPWGNTEWDGDYGDASALWTEELKEELQYEDADNGIFYMPYHQFVKYFADISICKFRQDFHYSATPIQVGPEHLLEGDPPIAVNFSMKSNPLLDDEWESRGECTLFLIQENERSHHELNDSYTYAHYCFEVYGKDEEDGQWHHLATSPVSSAREVHLDIAILPSHEYMAAIRCLSTRELFTQGTESQERQIVFGTYASHEFVVSAENDSEKIHRVRKEGVSTAVLADGKPLIEDGAAGEGVITKTWEDEKYATMLVYFFKTAETPIHLNLHFTQLGNMLLNADYPHGVSLADRDEANNAANFKEDIDKSIIVSVPPNDSKLVTLHTVCSDSHDYGYRLAMVYNHTNYACLQCQEPILAYGKHASGTYRTIPDKGRVHEECYNDYRIATGDTCIMCKKLVDGQYYTIDTEDCKGKCHMECHADYLKSIGEVCAHCGEVIEGEYYTEEENKIHSACYEKYKESTGDVCFICKKAIVGQFYDEEEGKVHVECYDEYRNLTCSCMICDEVIEGQFFEVDDEGTQKKVHSEGDCWQKYQAKIGNACYICGKGILGEYYTEEQGKVHAEGDCHQEHKRRTAPKCAVCGEPCIERHFTMGDVDHVHKECADAYDANDVRGAEKP